MSSRARQASSGRASLAWHRINWVACHRRVRSLHRRIVQAAQPGAWRKVKRLTDLVVHAFAARALAVKRVTENTGKKTPGVEGARWETPAKKAHAGARMGRWRGYRPAPLKRIDIPKKNGQQRPRSIPTLTDRARQAVDLQALQPIADTTGDQHSYGLRPKRRCADAIEQCVKILRQRSSAPWILEGDLQGCFDNMGFAGLETPIPRPNQLLATWLRSGFMDHGALFPTTAGVPPGGILSPVISTMVWDGLEAVVQGGNGHRRVHHINDVRWADDVLVPATAREVLEETVLPRSNAVLAARGVRRSRTKTVRTHISQGLDFFGQTLRTYERPQGKPAKRQMPPSKASLQAINARVKALWKQSTGSTPAQLIGTLNPVLRGWANYHRHVICGTTFAHLDGFVWRRLCRWAKRRHPDKTGRWIAARYFPHPRGEPWRFTDPDTGTPILRLQEAVNPQRHIKVKGDANPFDPTWEVYCQPRDRQLTLHASSPGRATILNQQTGLCPVCRQVIPCEEVLARHHRDGHHQNNRLAHLVVLHPTCHRQVHYGPERKTDSLRPSRGVGHA
jgi:RNA-directed DNA polymerase